MLKKPMNVVFAIFTVFTVGMMIPFTLACINVSLDSVKNKPESYELPSLWDLKQVGISALICAVIEKFFKEVLSPLYLSVCKVQEEPSRTLRSIKMAR